MQNWRWVFLVIALALASSLIWPKENGLGVGIDMSRRAQAARNALSYNPEALFVMKSVLREVDEHYVDPERIDWKRMLLSGLDAVQRQVAPVIVDYSEGADEFQVRVHSARKKFPLRDLDSPWTLSHRFSDVVAFLYQQLHDESDVDFQKIEYAATNGMLRTLDPHSVLLTPDIFEEMRTSTSGQFGGLGIVISIVDGALTVRKPMKSTPAEKAGLLRGDRIVQIEDESTLNMPLSEAVDRLRGEPGSKVSIHTSRKDDKGVWSVAKLITLTRALIHIPSVESRMLQSNIAYVKINSFQGNTSADLQSALEDLHKKKMKALVLDLRDDPGGLLDQAIEVCDLFLTGGAIVSTSSRDPDQREERVARAAGTEPNYPMVVLINGGSASASEIVAGALKNHDRALIVGQTSFGKGSVQVIYDLQDGSALKLTVAQYLTPGDISIQTTGIVPDVAIQPLTVDAEDMDLEPNEEYLRELDLRSHLTNVSVHNDEKSSLLISYYLDPKVRRRLLEADPNQEEENEAEENFLIRFSRELLSQANDSERGKLLELSKKVATKVEAVEMEKVRAELNKLGVDWRAGSNSGKSEVKTSASTEPSDQGRAGAAFALRVQVTNTGKQALYQVRATTDSDNPLFNEREMVFGYLPPGATRTWTSTLGECRTIKDKRECKLPPGLIARADAIKINFQEQNGNAPAPLMVQTKVLSRPAPRFAYGIQIADGDALSSDGQISPGEKVFIYLQLRNIGTGSALNAQANLRNKAGKNVMLQDARFELGEIKPGEEKTVAFSLEIKGNVSAESAEVEAIFADPDMNIGGSELIKLPIVRKQSATIKSVKREAVALDGSVFHEEPGLATPVVAKAKGSIKLGVTGESNGFARVDLGRGRPAWIAASALVQPTSTRGVLVYSTPQMTPEIKVNLNDSLVTRNDTIEVRGAAKDNQRVRDVYIYADSRKVFYQANGDEKNPQMMDFSATVPLHGGINYLTVVARESSDLYSRQTYVVRRDAKDGSLIPTPKQEAEAFELMDSEGESELP